MIADPKRHPRDPRVVLAVGPRYEFERVLSVAAVFVESLAGPAARFFPDGIPSFRAGFSGRDNPLGPDSYERLKRVFRERRKRYDVDDYECRFDLGKLRVRARLLGYDALHPHLLSFKMIDDRPADQLDPSPMLVIHRKNHPGGLMTEAQRKLVAKVCDAAEAQGLAVDRAEGGLVKEVCFITFPHAIFGAGEGPLRIRLVR